MIIYYILSIAATLTLVFIVPEHLIINKGSLCVIFIMGLMIFLSYYFKNNQTEKDLNTAYGSGINKDKQKNLFDLLHFSFKFYIPLCLPFFFFLIEWKKIVAVGILFVAAFITGPILFRIKYGKITKTKFEKGKKDL